MWALNLPCDSHFPSQMTTLGALVEVPTCDKFLNGVKGLINSSLPEGWKQWRVLTEPSPANVKLDRNRLRFILPTVELVKLYKPGTTYISEKRFKTMKADLLSWPPGRALISSPSEFAKSLRPSEEDWTNFIVRTEHLKVFVLSRSDVNRKLSSTPTSGELREQSPKAPSYETLSTPRSASASELMLSHLEPVTARLSALEEKLQHVSSLESKFDAFSQHMMSMSFQTPATHHPRTDVQVEDFSSNESENDSYSVSSNLQSESVNQSGGGLWAPHAVSAENLVHEEEFNFDPRTVIQEPECPDPEPRIQEYLQECQQWGKDSWNRIPYKEAEKKLRHGGGFQPLLINSQLLGRGRDDGGLRQFERIIGNVQYGVMAQRDAFSKATETFLASAPKEARKLFIETFSSERSEFRQVSQDLVQYVCGKRSEVVSQRRNQFIPKDPSLRRALISIPPSSSHIFVEESLSKCSLPPISRTQTSTPKRKYRPFSSAQAPGNPRPKQPRLSTIPRSVQRTFPGSRKEDRRIQGHSKSSSTFTGEKRRQRLKHY